jgi:DNA-directed RNA polymerase specialized sigma24 family protein
VFATGGPGALRFPAVDDRALATSLAGGHLDGLLAVYDSYADRLFGYGSGLLGSEDAAIGAIRDALLIAGERAGALPEPTRLAPWLYALTRNECVRRLRHADGDDLDRELASLTRRHRLAPADIAAIVGLSIDETTHRLRAVVAAAPPDGEAGEDPAGEPAAPAALRAQLIAGAGADAEEYRAALARRAGPFGADGFPQPLDQRRITGGVLAWSTAAAVLIALALLVVLPGKDSPAGGTTLAALPGGVTTSSPQPAALPQPSFTTPDAWPVPPAASLRPPTAPPPVEPAVTDEPATDTPAAAPPAAPPGASRLPPGPDRQGPESAGGVVSWYQNRTAPACPTVWTARLHAAVLGADAAEVTGVVASWTDQGRSHPVTLQRSDREWVATVSGLPTGRAVSLVVRASTAGGRTVSGAQQLLYRCR